MANIFRSRRMTIRNRRFRLLLSGQPFYIDPDNGSDSNDGLTEQTPWQTWGKVTSEGVWADNAFLAKGGTTAREKVVIGGNGATLGTYGSGNHVIRGADVAANASWTKTGGRTNVYQFTYTAASGTDATSMAWEDGAQLTGVADVATCDSTAGSYVLNGGVMYVHAGDSSNVISNGKLYELPAREVCLDFDDSLNCKVNQGIELTGAWSDNSNYGNLRVSGQQNRVKDIQSHDCRRHALQVLDSNAVACEYNVIDGGKFYGCVGNTVSFFSGGGALGTNYNTLRNAEVTQEGEPDGRGGLLILHSSSSRTNPLIGNRIVNNNIHDQTDTSNSWAIILNIEVQNTQITGNTLSNLRGTLASVKLEDNVSGTRFTGNICYLDVDNGFFFLDEGATNTNTDNWACNNGFIARGSALVKCVGWQNSATNGKAWNNYFTGVNDDCIRVADVGSQSGFSSNYNMFHNILDAQPFRWGASNYSFADWKTNTSQDANSTTDDPNIDADGLMAAHVLGGFYWSGEAAPKDKNDKSFSADTPSIGPVQFDV